MIDQENIVYILNYNNIRHKYCPYENAIIFTSIISEYLEKEILINLTINLGQSLYSIMIECLHSRLIYFPPQTIKDLKGEYGI